MKQKNNNRMSKLLLTTLMVAGSLSAYADSESTLTGTIKDEKGEPLIGVTVWTRPPSKVSPRMRMVALP